MRSLAAIFSLVMMACLSGCALPRNAILYSQIQDASIRENHPSVEPTVQPLQQGREPPFATIEFVMPVAPHQVFETYRDHLTDLGWHLDSNWISWPEGPIQARDVNAVRGWGTPGATDKSMVAGADLYFHMEWEGPVADAKSTRIRIRIEDRGWFSAAHNQQYKDP